MWSLGLTIFRAKICVFRPLFTLLQMIYVLSRAVPSNFLSNYRVYSRYLTRSRSFTGFVGLRRFVDVYYYRDIGC